MTSVASSGSPLFAALEAPVLVPLPLGSRFDIIGVTSVESSPPFAFVDNFLEDVFE